MKTAKFSKLERRVGHTASRRARRQLMHVPWDRFHKAYEEYIRRQAFALWARAVVESKAVLLPGSKAILRKHCPGFLEETVRSRKPELLGSPAAYVDSESNFLVLQKTRDGLMRSCSMDSETSAPRDTGRIGSIAKANGRNNGQRHFPPLCSGGVQP